MARLFGDSTVAFVLGGFLLAVSLGFDELLPGLYFVEDAAKLLGAPVWLIVPPLCLPASIFERSRR